MLERAEFILRTKCYDPKRFEIERLSGKLLDIDQCYINLAIIERGRQAEQENKRSSVTTLFAQQRVETPDEAIRVNLATLFDPREGLARPPRRILIRGRAGVGKTCLCKKIIHEFTHRPDSRLRLPWKDLFDRILWIPLRKLKYQSHDGWNLETLFYNEYFKDEEENEGRSLGNELRKAVMETENKTLFILDGFDEISGSFDRTDNKRRILLTLINQPNAIITSRPTGALPNDIQAVDIELETIGFYPEQVDEYVNQSFTNPKDVQDVRNFLQGHQLVQGLVRIPILLDALCYTWVDSQSTKRPSTMTEIYQDIEQKLWRKDALRLGKQHNGRELTEAELASAGNNAVESICRKERQFLEHLAFVGLYHDVVEFSTKDLDDVPGPGPGIFPVADLLPLSFLRASDNSLEPENQSYHFIHLTFQEYFAAQYFVRQWRSSETHNVLPTGDRFEPNQLSPVELLQKHKYTARFDIFWRFVTGLLGKPDLVPRFINTINAEPLDLLGPAHQRLVMHCLGEVSSSTHLPSRYDLEEELSQWLLYECSLKNWSTLASEIECTENAIIKALEEASRETSWDILSGVRSRTMLTPKLSEKVVSFLDGRQGLEEPAERVLHSQKTLPDKAIAALARLLANRNSSVRSSAAHVLCNYQCWNDAQLMAMSSRLKNMKLDALAKVLNLFVKHSKPPKGLLEDITSYLYCGANEIYFDAFIVLHHHKALPENLYEIISSWLSHGDSEIRRHGVEALTLFTVQHHSRLPGELRDFWVALLKDPDESVRDSVTETLEWQDLLSDNVFRALWPLFQGDSWSEEKRIFSDTTISRDSKPLALLLCADETIRAAALVLIRHLAQLHLHNARSHVTTIELHGPGVAGQNELVSVFNRLLRNENEQVRVLAIQVLKWEVKNFMPELESEEIQLVMVDILMPVVAQDKSVRVRDAAVELLLEQRYDPSSKAITALISLVESKDVLEFLESLITASRIPPDGFEFAVSSLKHEDNKVREIAIRILEKQPTTSKSVLGAVISLLEDTDENVQEAAVNFISKRPNIPAEALKTMMSLLEHQKTTAWQATLKALCKQPTIPEKVVEAVLSRLEDEDYYVRESAIKAVRRRPTLPNRILEAVVLNLDNSKAVKCLLEQTTLPDKVLEDVVTKLGSEFPDAWYGAEAILRHRYGPYLDLFSGPYFKSLYRVLLEKSFEEQLSFYIDGDNLYINFPDGIREITIVNKEDDWRRKIYRALPKSYPSISAKRWRPKDIR